ncbi:hypothetical protein LAUMK142_05801 [Mycobacterium pseudokansasii]|uniref:Uncharacterized protein n=1 Tax=Mycobacterium pseudokansasii TaxID=2341080 RepID=A0A498R0G7_9MYCO|nr:hypothetical protein LAUMK142_05801 [Mycobacterium pseudokansasii]
MKLELPLTRTLWWTRAVHSVRVAGRSVTGLMHRRARVEQGPVHPRHYPPRSSWFLDNDLMEREMYDHAPDKPTQ